MKPFLKSLANALAALIVLPALLFYQSSRLAFGADFAFPGWSQAFSLIPGLSGVYLRRAFYRMVLRRCGADACLGFGLVLSNATTAIGRRVYIGVHCCFGEVTLEDDAMIGSHVSIINGGSQHGIDRLDLPVRKQPGTWPRICIGRNSWIGERAVIMADIGSHCVIGAGSVVTRAIPDYAVAAGVPARVIRYRNSEIASQDSVASPTTAMPASQMPARI